jgi:hypothetical protein
LAKAASGQQYRIEIFDDMAYIYRSAYGSIRIAKAARNQFL